MAKAPEPGGDESDNHHHYVAVNTVLLKLSAQLYNTAARSMWNTSQLTIPKTETENIHVIFLDMHGMYLSCSVGHHTTGVSI